MACPAVAATNRRMRERSSVQTDSSHGKSDERSTDGVAGRAAPGDAGVIVGHFAAGGVALETRDAVVRVPDTAVREGSAPCHRQADVKRVRQRLLMPMAVEAGELRERRKGAVAGVA